MDAIGDVRALVDAMRAAGDAWKQEEERITNEEIGKKVVGLMESQQEMIIKRKQGRWIVYTFITADDPDEDPSASGFGQTLLGALEDVGD